MNLPRDVLPLAEIAIDYKEIPGWKRKENGKIWGPISLWQSCSPS
jgi:hypothetical protein